MDQIKRWRLILGEETQEKLSELDEKGLSLTGEELLMDHALQEIYANRNFQEVGESDGTQGGRGKSFPEASKWLGDIQSIFNKDIVKIIQNDAIERCGLKQLLMEPEVLDNMEPDVNLASTIMLIKEQVPAKSKENVRRFIKKIVEDINKRLAEDVRKVISAKLNKKEHSPIPSARAIDFKYTIQRNLKNYNQEYNTIIPEKIYFYDSASKNDSNKWTIILDVDKSYSMGESVIYSSVLSCILASVNAVKTKIVSFDTQVVDLTHLSDDPVELLYGFNMGGGTDINKSIAYCETLIENPSKTIFFLISDLEEGGNASEMLNRLGNLKEQGVVVVSLLAITDSGTPHYDKAVAEKIGKLGISCFACSPNQLPELLTKALNHQGKLTLDSSN
ncbi:MAG: VWA domain-containing protein [Eubacteriales bacterium]